MGAACHPALGAVARGGGGGSGGLRQAAETALRRVHLCSELFVRIVFVYIPRGGPKVPRDWLSTGGPKRARAFVSDCGSKSVLEHVA